MENTDLIYSGLRKSTMYILGKTRNNDFYKNMSCPSVFVDVWWALNGDLETPLKIGGEIIYGQCLSWQHPEFCSVVSAGLFLGWNDGDVLFDAVNIYKENLSYRFLKPVLKGFFYLWFLFLAVKDDSHFQYLKSQGLFAEYFCNGSNCVKKYMDWAFWWFKLNYSFSDFAICTIKKVVSEKDFKNLYKNKVF